MEDFSGAVSGESLELPRQSPQPGNTGKYMPIRAGPIRKIPYWASSIGHIFSRIAQLRTLAWQLLGFTRKYDLSRTIYYSIVLKYCKVIENENYALVGDFSLNLKYPRLSKH